MFDAGGRSLLQMRQKIFTQGKVMRSSRRLGVGPLLRGVRSLGVVAVALLAFASGGADAAAATADSPSCRVVRLADVGWTAETATTAVLGQMLTDLGVQKMRVIGAPKRMHGISGFGLEVIEYVSVDG